MINEKPYWGQQTALAIKNFGVSGEVFPLSVIREIALLKAEAARVNQAMGRLSLSAVEVTSLIEAAEAVASGAYDDQFPIDVFQTGSGTSSNMNVNEVIASIATERAGAGALIHPNDHVNASQSSNDVVPSAVHMAVSRSIHESLIPALDDLRAELDRLARDNDHVVKIGRTHLMDAVPVMLGQEFGGMARSIELALVQIMHSLDRLMELPLGGTAVGTGLNAPPGFAVKVIEALRLRTGLPWVEAVNHFEAQGNRDALVQTSAACRGLALSLFKMANDLRWMASGPVGGLGEITLPALQSGSSIMPGKVNPIVPEVVCQVAAQVIGNDAAVAFAGSSGSFELNVMIPVMARNVLQSVRLLSGAASDLSSKCLHGLVANKEAMADVVGRSSMVATGLNETLGYDRARQLVEESERTGISVAELSVRHGYVDTETAERLTDPARLALPPR